MPRVIRSILLYGVLGLFAVITLVPFAYLFTASFKTNADFFSSLFLPTNGAWYDIAWERLTTEHYQRLLGEAGFLRYVVNSFFLASVTSVLATLCAAMGGYALAKFHFRGRQLFTDIVLLSLIIPGALLLAPGYQLLYWLGLLDTYPGLILPAAAPAFGIYLFRQAILSCVPDEILESARIDGAGEVRIFFEHVLPLVRPMIGAFMLITFLGTWNNFIAPQIVLTTPEKYPLAVAVAQLKGTYSQDYGMLMAGTAISVVPLLVLFLMLQKEFIAGLTSGAVKG